MLRRCRRHKERRRCSVQILDKFWDKRFGYKLLIELANKLRHSMHRRCLRDFHCFVLIILRPLLFSVRHFLRNLTLSGKTYHSKILKILRKIGNDSEVLVTPCIFPLLRNRQKLERSQAPQPRRMPVWLRMSLFPKQTYTRNKHLSLLLLIKG